MGSEAGLQPQENSCWSLMGTCLLPPWLGGRRPAGCLHTFRDGTLPPGLSKVAHYTAGLGPQFLRFLLPSCLGSIPWSRRRTSFHSSDREGRDCVSVSHLQGLVQVLTQRLCSGKPWGFSHGRCLGGTFGRETGSSPETLQTSATSRMFSGRTSRVLSTRCRMWGCSIV